MNLEFPSAQGITAGGPGPAESEVAQIVRDANCGFVVDPGDVVSFVKAVETLSRDPGLVTAMGHRVRSAFDSKYERKIGTSKIASLLRSL